MPFRYTLLADGTSDAALLRVIDWMLTQHAGRFPMLDVVSSDFAAPSDRPSGGDESPLRNRVRDAAACDLLFVHRDAERDTRANRLAEIQEAVLDNGFPAWVPVVPVRMTEAWLLIDPAAIREAAGNPNGSTSLQLPAVRRLEDVPDPKQLLFDCLSAACGLNGRRLRKFQRDLPELRSRVAAAISDFSPLRNLGAFRALEADTIAALERVMHS